MGQSGLRRFYSTGADLGELINRQVTYQVASRIEARRAQNPAAPLPPLASDTEGYVAQVDSLNSLATTLPHPLMLRMLARSAKRLERDKVHSRNDRYDLGLLYAPATNAYIALGIGAEQTRAELKFATGSTDVTAIGPRVDAGLALRPWLALGLRAEDLRFTGDNSVITPLPGGSVNVRRDLEYRRRYLQVENILRFTRAQWSVLPAGWQLGGMAAVHYLDTRYENQVNSLGQAVVEPFGNHERLGLVRGGLFLQAAFGANGATTPYVEVLRDYEFDTNMARPLDGRNSMIVRAGIARTFGPGKRLSLEYQRSESRNALRERGNLILLLVYDF
jgi:hypothetical protein